MFVAGAPVDRARSCSPAWAATCAPAAPARSTTATTATSTRGWRAPPTGRSPPGASRRAPRCGSASCSARCLRVLELSSRQPARRRAVASRLRRLRGRLHDLAEAPTPQNIVIGGAAGAVPPLVGWAAVTGGLSGTALYLFAIVFFWTPPHFWALSLLMKDEYAKVGVPMLPVVRGERETRRQILLYTLLLYAVTQLPFCAGGFGGDLPRRLAAARASPSSPAPSLLCTPGRPPRRAAPLPLLARLPRAAVRRDGGSTSTSDRIEPRWTATSPARTSAPA